jgi:hypothetical protein
MDKSYKILGFPVEEDSVVIIYRFRISIYEPQFHYLVSHVPITSAIWNGGKDFCSIIDKSSYSNDVDKTRASVRRICINSWCKYVAICTIPIATQPINCDFVMTKNPAFEGRRDFLEFEKTFGFFASCIKDFFNPVDGSKTSSVPQVTSTKKREFFFCDSDTCCGHFDDETEFECPVNHEYDVPETKRARSLSTTKN